MSESMQLIRLRPIEASDESNYRCRTYWHPTSSHTMP